MRALLITALACTSCARAVEAPMDAGVVDARTLLQVALDARSRLDSPRWRVQMRTDIASALARTSSLTRARAELTAAIDEARAIGDANDRDRALAHAARAALKMAQREDAARILAELRDPEDKADLAADLAIDTGAALAIPTAPERDRALARLAREAANAADLDRAGALAARITDGSVKAPVMGAICAAMLHNNRVVDAKRMAGQLDGLARSEAQAVLAVDAARKNDLRGADRWADSLESDPLRARTLAEIALARPPGSGERKRFAARALQTALDVQSADLRTEAVESLVKVWANAGDALGADTVLGTALAAPVRSEPGKNALDASGARRVRVLVATAYAAEGDTASAARVAGAIDDPILVADAWAAIARASLRAGLVEAALAAAARIVPDELRVPVIAEIAVAPGPAPTSTLRAALTSALVR